MADLKIRLQPKQSELWELWDDDVTRLLGGGGSRGGAKSGGGRRCMLLRRLKYPRTAGLILRRSLKELEHSHLIKLFEEYPELRPWYRDQKKQLIFPNGSVLFFGSAQNEKDMSDFYSAEYADILVDEAQEFAQMEIEKLSGSNRCTSNPDITAKMVLTFMPSISESGLPPIGLRYLKRIFVDKELTTREQQMGVRFVQSFSWDNIEWARKELTADGIGEEEFYSWSEDDRRTYFITQTEYGQKLAALTNPALRDAWLYGKWDVFQGQYFPNFVAAKHVISEAETINRLKPWHKRWVSLDWGYDHPFCVHWHAQDETGRVTTYREFWGREMNEIDLAKEIGRRSLNEKLIAFPCSWDAGKLSPRAMRDIPKSIVQMITDALPPTFPRPFPADSSPGTRPSGARLLSQLLDSSMWQIAENCGKLIECMPGLIRDPKNTEDVMKTNWTMDGQLGDDPYDCARMGLSYMLGAARRPAIEDIRERAQAIEDPTARWFFIHKEESRARDAQKIRKPASIPTWQNKLK